MTFDRKAVWTLVLIAWSGFFTWLWVSGETVRYLGPRTAWLVPVGALTLAAAAIACARASRVGRGVRPSRADLAGLIALLLPIAIGVLFAHSQIGALAASKKLTARGIDPAALGELASRGSHDVSFLQLSVAARDSKFARENDIQPGREVRLLGFVTHAPQRPGGQFELSRFYVACCVADAIPFGAAIDQSVVRGQSYDRDQWLEVSGEVVRRGRRLSIRATKVRRVKPPDEPYLSFAT
jgi:putative membrane protein